MSTVEQHVHQVRQTRPELPDRLPLSVERECLSALTSYFHRIQDARVAFEADKLESPSDTPFIVGPPKARSVAFHHVDLTDDEAEAAWTLYVGLVALVGREVARFWRAWDTDLSLQDALSDSFFLFLKTLSAFDPEKGTRISTWVTIDIRHTILSYLRRHSCNHTDCLEDMGLEEEPYELPAPGLGVYVDTDDWAREIASDESLKRVWHGLNGRDK